MTTSHDRWASGAAYEPYVGRWSRRVAREFIAWLDIAPHRRWLDAGCGTGALSKTILESASPSGVVGMDTSDAYIAYARDHIPHPTAHFQKGDLQAIPFGDAAFEVAVSGLVLNFVAEPDVAVREMARVVRDGGAVAAYVWDYADKMEMMRYFWNVAAVLDPTAAPLDEGVRFPLCHPASLQTLFQNAGLASVEVRAIDVPTLFHDFDDYWTPFLGGQGPAPGYLATLDAAARDTLREAVRAALPVADDGSIALVARAWGVKGARGAA